MTVNLDEDLYRMAKACALAEECSISAAVNKLLREATASSPPSGKRGRGRFPVSACREDRVITSGEVGRLEMEDDAL
jgi:hypothetical protein